MVFNNDTTELWHFMPYALVFGNTKTITPNNGAARDNHVFANLDLMVKRDIWVESGTFSHLRAVANHTTGADYSIRIDPNVIIYCTIRADTGSGSNLAILANHGSRMNAGGSFRSVIKKSCDL